MRVALVVAYVIFGTGCAFAVVTLTAFLLDLVTKRVGVDEGAPCQVSRVRMLAVYRPRRWS